MTEPTQEREPTAAEYTFHEYASERRVYDGVDASPGDFYAGYTAGVARLTAQKERLLTRLEEVTARLERLDRSMGNHDMTTINVPSMAHIREEARRARQAIEGVKKEDGDVHV